jgi:hypothetical protein
MAFLNKFRCEVCGRVTGMPVLWLVIQSRESHLTILSWSAEAARAPGAAHVCGEADAQIYLSRWLHSLFLKAKALPAEDAEPLITRPSDSRSGYSGREPRRTFGLVPVQAALQRG